MSTPEMALLNAVTGLLRASAPVAALVATKILDEVPQDRNPINPPYVYVGPISRARLPDSHVRAWTMRMRLYAASTGFGRRQAWEIADAVAAVLDRTDIALTGPYQAVDHMLVMQAGDVTGPPSPKTAFVDIEVIVQEETSHG